MHPRLTPPRPWQPLSDAEYAALSAFLPPERGGRGRPPADRRRTLDAIFWVACSRGPWHALPPELGVRPDTAHRQLRRWARAGLLDRLLFAVSPRGRRRVEIPALAGLEYWICRAWRRMARLASLGSLLLARRLGLRTALPCAPCYLPDPDLSETVQRIVSRLLENPFRAPPGAFALCARALHRAGGAPHRFRLK